MSASTPALRPKAAPALKGSSRFYHQVLASLLRQGFTHQEAIGLAGVYLHAYIYVHTHWKQISRYYDKADKTKTVYDTSTSGLKAFRATVLIRNATMMGASVKVVEGMSSVRMVAGAGVLSGLVAVMEIVAEQHKVPLNKCALSISKVSLDLAGVVGGGLTSETGFGAVLAAMSLVSLGKDGLELAESLGFKKGGKP